MVGILLTGDFAGPCVAETLGGGSVTVAGIPVGVVPDSDHSHGTTVYGCGPFTGTTGLQGVTCEGAGLYSVGLVVECNIDVYERSPTNPPLADTVTVGD